MTETLEGCWELLDWEKGASLSPRESPQRPLPLELQPQGEGGAQGRNDRSYSDEQAQTGLSQRIGEF